MLRLGVFALAAALAGGTALAQNAPAPAGNDRATQKQRIERIDAELRDSTAAQQQLVREIEGLKGDRAKLNAALLETAIRVRETEGKLDASEQRLLQLGREEADIRDSLESRRKVLAEVLGGLVRLGRRPPPALMVRPDDALQSVRSAMLLGAVLPELKAETDLLASELAAQERVRQETARERDALADLKVSLADERRRTTALVEEKKKSLDQGEAALAGEKTRAAALAAEAGNVRELMQRMETEIEATRKAAQEAAKMPADQGSAAKLAALQNPGRLSPGMPFEEAKGVLPLPVGGAVLKAFGTEDGYGGQEKGVSFATRMEAQVASPSDGWVVYAGPFRSYGQLLIINAGGGYHILLAGMDKITVELGQFVLSGEPVAVMGRGPQLVSSASLGTAQPILYVEFRKDGNSIDPAPWWATSESEKVRG
ncbi:peptidoglycan DD-metalloendopeptidase family protein [Starkeya koreensis]|uniref:Peptidoglycan DD-metalloendopeptidase family protein n=1 Tax=Ancylobacter koreensis TaxID=266121 RepID=A0ABT0DH57_9HYPH|nr:peptidoglycan DD-metalloendopeptidase family protein [Ancylobacter koreensis]MCK0206544.1 peptidoglycan DD-metalloendopeptidase family protein [Ancylobacter koreensis]